MMSRGNMGKQIANAPKSKKVKKMFGGGMARPGMMPPGSAVRPVQAPPPGGMGSAGFARGLTQVASPGSAVRGAKPGGVRPKPAPMPGRPQLMAAGGKVGRGDGCCMKGKTKGKMC